MRALLVERLPRAGSAAKYSLVNVGVGLGCMLATPLLLFSAALCMVGVGFLIMPQELQVLGRFADFERHRAGERLGRSISGHGVRGKGLGALLAEPRTRRDLAWTPVQMVTGSTLGILGLGLALLPLMSLAAIGLWWLFPADAPVTVLANIPVNSWSSAVYAGVPMFLISVALMLYGLPWLADLNAKLSAAMLAPSEKEELAERVETLRESRAGAVDAHGAELRRIEQDLHDGTQARLVSIAMRLGLAERQLAKDPQSVATLLAEARAGAEDAMTELRDTLRTMYPPILADRGLDGALSAVAARCPLPVELTVGELGTVAAPVEAAAYFVVNEALTNVVKHAAATRAEVTVLRDGDLLRAQIEDDGQGGIDETRGTGIPGMRRRLAALDGSLWVTSPAGGPTMIVLECPCAS
ncbi:sensor histidine kinase [Amycolatopsis nigrescens]|uniref:sensor histidine kinase n=1 Tax=Amycolatopsis nigrescens TaxID=381445 RepID=UPI00036ECFD9|nr:histidine kinase [Amycolatopsis nigrescens]